MEISLAAWMTYGPVAVAVIGVLQHRAEVGLQWGCTNQPLGVKQGWLEADGDRGLS